MAGMDPDTLSKMARVIYNEPMLAAVLCVVCGNHINMNPMDHAGQLLAHLRSHWGEAGEVRRTTLVLEYLHRRATDVSKPRDDRIKHYHTSIVVLHHLGYKIRWEEYPTWVTDPLDPE